MATASAATVIASIRMRPILVLLVVMEVVLFVGIRIICTAPGIVIRLKRVVTDIADGTWFSAVLVPFHFLHLEIIKITISKSRVHVKRVWVSYLAAVQFLVVQFVRGPLSLHSLFVLHLFGDVTFTTVPSSNYQV